MKDKLKNIATAIVTNYEDLEMEKAKINQQYRNERITRKVADEQLIKITRKTNDLINSLSEQFYEISNEYKDLAHEWETFKGDQLTEDAKLFEADLEFTAEQYESKIEQYKNNATMLNIIYNHARKSNVNPGSPYAITAEQKIKNFNEIATVYERATRGYLQGNKLEFSLVETYSDNFKDIELGSE